MADDPLKEDVALLLKATHSKSASKRRLSVERVDQRLRQYAAEKREEAARHDEDPEAPLVHPQREASAEYYAMLLDPSLQPVPTAEKEQEEIDEYLAHCVRTGEAPDVLRLMPPCFRRDKEQAAWLATTIAVLMTPVMIVRVLLFTLCVMMHLFVCRILSMGCDLHNLAVWRERVIAFSGRFTGRFTMMCAGFWWLTHVDKQYFDRSKHRPGMLLFNHTGAAEILMSAALAHPSWVSKKAVRNLFIFGGIMDVNRAVWVDRSGSGNEDMVRQMIDRQTGYDANRPQIMIFPEGTTTNGKYMLRFRKGAFYAGMPVQPVLQRYRWRRFDPTWEAGLVNVFWYMWRLGTQFANCMEVIHMPVYFPSEEEKADPELYAENVRTAMARRLGASLINGVSWKEKYLYRDLFKGRIDVYQYDQMLAQLRGRPSFRTS